MGSSSRASGTDHARHIRASKGCDIILTFNKKKHTYKINGQKVPSVTQVIGRLKQPFDSKKHAVKVATVEGIKTKDVLAKWANRSKIALNKGTEVHRFIERRLKGKDSKHESYLAEMAAWDRWRTEHPYPLVLVEQPICDIGLKIAGTIDALFYNEKYIPYDWKTGSMSYNGYQNLKEPFQDLEECSLIIYSLQLSLYKLILQRTTDYEIGTPKIAHLTKNGEYKIYEAMDFSNRLKSWLLKK